MNNGQKYKIRVHTQKHLIKKRNYFTCNKIIKFN